jgi:tetratricopeptide (TPR) repeat protein
VARCERDLAILAHGAGDYQQAETLLRQALATQQELLGADHVEVARTLAALGNALKRLGQRDAAHPLFQRALVILEGAPAEEAALAKVLSSYALLLTGDDDPSQAIPLLRRAIAIEVRRQGANSPSAGAYHLNLGVALRFAGDFDAALVEDQQALAITEATYGREHTSYASILNEIGSSWAGKGDIARAREAYQRSIEVKEKVLGADHPSTLDAQRNLAMLLADQDPRAAKSLLEKVLAGNERALGPRHPGVAQSLFDLGKLRADQGGAGERAAAEAQMRRGLAIYRATPDVDSFDLASGLADLGALLCAGDKEVEGSPMLHEAVEIWTRHPSPYAPDLAKLAKAAQDCKPVHAK